MRFSFLTRLMLVVAAASLSLSLLGCDSKPQEAQGPEMGEIEAYLQEHPEERVDDPDEAGDESEEFEAGS